PSLRVGEDGHDLLYDFPRPCARGLAAANGGRAADDDVANADRELHRILEGGPVRHRPRVEDDEVGAVAVAHEADAFEPEGLRRLRRHLAHGLLEGQGPLLAHVAPEYARVGAISARVGPAAEQ